MRIAWNRWLFLHEYCDGKEGLAAFLEKARTRVFGEGLRTSAILSVVALEPPAYSYHTTESGDVGASNIPSSKAVCSGCRSRLGDGEQRCGAFGILTAPTRAWNNLAAARSAVVLTAIEEPILGLK